MIFSALRDTSQIYKPGLVSALGDKCMAELSNLGITGMNRISDSDEN
jgi:hypothetical protein